MLSVFLSYTFNLILRLWDATIGEGISKPIPDESQRATVYIDTETTGFNAVATPKMAYDAGATWSIHDEGPPAQLFQEVIQVGMVVEKAGRIVHRVELNIRPAREWAINPKAAEVNGYTPEGWASLSAMDKGEAVQWLMDFWWGECCSKVNGKWLFPHVVGQNIGFDLHFLHTLTQEVAGKTLPMGGLIDTLTMSKRLGTPSHSLDFLRSWLGWDSDGAHTALKDAEDTRRLHHLCRDIRPLRLFVISLMGRWRTTEVETPRVHG